MRYHRYMKFERARMSLCDNLFKVSVMSEFNDPSECRARFVASGDVPALHKYIHEIMKVECVRRMNAFTPETQAILTEDTNTGGYNANNDFKSNYCHFDDGFLCRFGGHVERLCNGIYMGIHI